MHIPHVPLFKHRACAPVQASLLTSSYPWPPWPGAADGEGSAGGFRTDAARRSVDFCCATTSARRANEACDTSAPLQWLLDARRPVLGMYPMNTEENM